MVLHDVFAIEKKCSRYWNLLTSSPFFKEYHESDLEKKCSYSKKSLKMFCYRKKKKLRQLCVIAGTSRDILC